MFPPLVFKPIEPENKQAYDNARSIVQTTIAGRRSEQGLNIYSFLTLFFGVFIIVGYFWLLQHNSQVQSAKNIARATERYEALHPTTPQPGYDNSGMYQYAPTTQPHIYSTETPTPMYTDTPQSTATALYSVNAVFKYSYYNPKLGGWNCATWDAVLNDCISMMANGEDWHNQYGAVVACAPEIALGTIIQITYPDALQGYWTCKDRGGLITGLWIDFLDITIRYSWGDPVSGILYPPTTPMEEITKGSH